MTTSNLTTTYDDIRSALDKALDSPKGIRIYEGSWGRLVNLRQRIFKLRALDRKQSMKIYEKDHPQYGQSAYDILSIQMSVVALEMKDKCHPSELFMEVKVRGEGSLKVEEIE